jgi:hypothetical protein
VLELTFVPNPLVDTKELLEVVQVGVPVKLVREGMVTVCVLMLPQDGVANEEHGPNAPFVDPWDSTGSEMAGIVPQRPHEPTGQCKQEGPKSTSLSIR